MNILILHRIPYAKIDYHRGVAHDRHDVTYVGTASALATIPAHLRAQKIERPGLLSAADEILARPDIMRRQFDRVISLSEYELADAARLRERFGVPGPTFSDVERVRNKVVMKHAVAAAGLRVPRFVRLDDFLRDPARAAWDGTTVLKPVDGASSEDLLILPSLQETHARIFERRTGIARLDGDYPRYDRFEIEEFVDGPILHIDGLVEEERLLTCVASRYVGTCAAYARGIPFGSVQIDDDLDLRSWTASVLSAVGITRGSFHLEAIEHDGELVFLEVAHRVGGADVVATFELATGIHLPSAELALILDEHKRRLPTQRRSQESYGWFVVPGHHLPTTHARVIGHERFITSPMMLRWNQLDESRPLPRTITYQALEVPAAGVVRGASSKELAGFLRSMFDSIRLVPIAAAMQGLAG
ncbi:MAG TPA: hypothetical protein VGZ00_01830 [Candidatus Baltobacteraceae bacterium]|jgi:hypothetical protein|nr:hypothetical protein [Candidatus Baltobacteraceae bacterium]